MVWLFMMLGLFQTLIPHPPRRDGEAQFGLEAGREWIYRGSHISTNEGGEIRTDSVRWTMRCVAVKQGAQLRVGLIRNWIADLAWQTPDTPVSFALLIEYHNQLSMLNNLDSAAALDSMNTVLKTDRPSSTAQLLIDSNLELWHSYGGESSHAEEMPGFYAWQVEEIHPLDSTANWHHLAAEHQEYQIIYRTQPDHLILEFVPGVGITHYTYSHHGTPEEVDVVLLEVRNAGTR